MKTFFLGSLLLALPAFAGDLHLSPETRLELKQALRSENEAALAPQFAALRESQALVAAFDLELAKTGSEEALDRLHGSQLYCRLLEARGNHEVAEQKLLFLHKTASKEARAWLRRAVSRFASKNAASAAAALQLRMRLHPSASLERELGSLLALKQAEIAAPADLSPGGCFGDSPAAEYDWNKRNWISGNLSEGEFVVTYDDGPHATLTEPIMQAWSDSGQPKPAFFWLSENALRLKPLVQAAFGQGFPVACHSERHADLGNLAKAGSAANLSRVNREVFGEELKNVSPAEFPAWKERSLDREILGASRTLESIVQEVSGDFRVKHFRLPFGSGVKNGAIGQRFESGNLDHFFWRVDSLDWQDKNSESVHKRVVSQMKAGKKGLILFHDIQAPTVATTKLLLETFRTTPGWKPVSIYKMVP